MDSHSEKDAEGGTSVVKGQKKKALKAPAEVTTVSKEGEHSGESSRPKQKKVKKKKREQESPDSTSSEDGDAPMESKVHKRKAVETISGLTDEPTTSGPKKEKKTKEKQSEDIDSSEELSAAAKAARSKARKNRQRKKRRTESKCAADEGESSGQQHDLSSPAHNADLEPSPSKKGGKAVLFGDAYLRLKERLRERKKRLKQIPRFYLQKSGLKADLRKVEPLKLKPTDISNLIVFSLVGRVSHYKPDNWCGIERQSNVLKTVAMVIDGVTIEAYMHHKSCCFSEWDEMLPHQVLVGCSGIDFEMKRFGMLVQPLSNRERKCLLKEGQLEEAVNTGRLYSSEENEESQSSRREPKPRRTDLLLSWDQMQENGYPLLAAKYSHFRFTKEVYKAVTPNSPMYSIDCEMCLTEISQNELTRVAVINERLEVVYETLVKPYNRIVNYLTQYSGITAAMLDGVTVRLEEVQRKLSDILPADAIIIGQSLNCDLIALQMKHPYVIDTSVLFNLSGEPKRKTKLSVLTEVFLGEQIQTRGKDGHHPVEDGVSAMKLVQLKLKKGITYGNLFLGGEVPGPDGLPLVNNSGRFESGHLSQCVLRQITDSGKTAEVVGEREVLQPYRVYTENHDLDEVVDLTEVESWDAYKERLESKLEKDYTVIQFDATEKLKRHNHGLGNCKGMRKVRRLCELAKSAMSSNQLLLIYFTGYQAQDPADSKSGVCFIRIL